MDSKMYKTQWKLTVMEAYKRDGNEIPWAHFAQIKLLFSTWNIKSQNKGFSSFFPGITTLCYFNQSHGTALFILMLIQKFQMFRDRHWSPMQSRALQPRASRKPSPSPMDLLSCYHHTHECALTLKKATKGDQNWSWSCGCSGSPFHTLLSHLYILLSIWKDLPPIEANKQIMKSASKKTSTHF